MLTYSRMEAYIQHTVGFGTETYVMEVTILCHRVVGYIWTAPEKAFRLYRKHRTLRWSGFAARRLITPGPLYVFPSHYFTHTFLQAICQSSFAVDISRYLIVFHCEVNGSVISKPFCFLSAKGKRIVICHLLCVLSVHLITFGIFG